MNQFKNFSDDLKAMFSSPQTPTSQKPSMNPRRVWIAVLFLTMTLAAGGIFGFLSSQGGGKESAQDQTAASESEQVGQGRASDGSVVIQFKGNGSRSGARGTYSRASSGTLVRVRLLNTLETFDTVPIFAQVTDYALGQSFYGWTLGGDASGDGNVNRIKMTFKSAKSPNGNNSLELSGQALSLDGTFGVKAEKVEGFTNRTLLGGGMALSGGLANSVKGTGDLQSLLLRALLTGLETEASSDLGSHYNRSTALRLDPGQEFFVQLMENF